MLSTVRLKSTDLWIPRVIKDFIIRENESSDKFIMSVLQVLCFVPNIMGYVRLLLTGVAFFVYFEDPVIFLR